MESLPTDIVQDILSRVPAEFVLGCKLVCKKWVTLIGGNRFANMHLTRQLNHFYHGDEGEDKVAANVDPCLFFACRTDDPDEFISLLFLGGQPSDRISRGENYIYNQNLKRIYHPPMHNEPLFDHLVGSCNGLVCAFQHHHLVIDPIYICNPLTREYVYVPQLVVKKEDTYWDNPNRVEGGEVDMLNYTTCGFGYVRSTNEYKVVRVHYLDSMEGNVEVYTLGSGCGWRAKGEVPYRLDTSSGGMGTYANDAIYWISDKTVVAFDLADEEFRALSSVPPRLENCQHGGDRIGLVALGRDLCLYIDDELRVEIWSLMKSRNSKETWRMEFDIDYQVIPGTCDRELQPILLTKSGEIIFLYSRSILYSYNPKTTVLKMISNEASTDNFEAMEAIAHVNTFASLGAMGENSKRYTVCTPLDDVIGDLDRVTLDEGIDTTRFIFRNYSMESLPLDIVQDILFRVPAESVLECKLVCKQWETLVGGRNFTDMHLKRQLNRLHGGSNDGSDDLAAKVDSGLFFACCTDDPVYKILYFNGGQPSDRIKNDEKYVYSQNLKRIYHPPTHEEISHAQFVGSCNGLVCVYQRHHRILDPIYICNPLTREYVHLPRLIVRTQDVDQNVVRIEGGEPDMLARTACGFGYLSSTNEYKVVRVYYLGFMEGTVEVYTLGSGCGWRPIGRVHHRLDTYTSRYTGTYVNDTIYWSANKKVVAFDLAKEEFQFLPVPRCVEDQRGGDRSGLAALGVHLCLYLHDDKSHVKIWSLMKSGDLKETWRMEFDIDYESLPGIRKRRLQPILLTKKGEIILLYADSVLYSYDMKTSVLKMISNKASTDHFESMEVIAHVNTFASLEATGENSKRYYVRPCRLRTQSDGVRDEVDRVALVDEEIDATPFRFGT